MVSKFWANEHTMMNKYCLLPLTRLFKKLKIKLVKINNK